MTVRTHSHRRMPAALALTVAGAIALAGCSSSAPAGSNTVAAGEPIAGGTITAAIAGDPQNLDMGLNTGALTIAVAQNVFEGLFAMDSSFVAQPMLAESYEVSDDGLIYTFTLRDEVPFHDGSIMDSADVVASLERWMSISAIGTLVAADLASLEAPDDSTVVLSLTTPRYSLIADLAWYVQSAIILPEEIAVAAGSEPLSNEEIIGTGPYELKEYTAGQRVELARFEEYAALTDELGGFAGAKEAYADAIDYVFVADAAQRLNGLKTGQWDWVQSISADDYESASADTALTVVPSATGVVNTLLLNHNDASAFADVRARQALNMLLDKNEIATATAGPEWSWSPLSPSMVVSSNAAMFSDAGEDVFFDVDPERAAELFAEAGVTEPIRILSTQTYPQFNQWAVLVQAALEEVGIAAEVSIYDYPTMVEMLSSDPTGWDLSMTYFTGTVTSPGQVLWLSPTWPGEYSNPDMDELLAQFQRSTSAEDALGVVDEIQTLVYEDFPVVQLGAVQSVGVFSKDLHLPDDWTGILWNAWISQ